MTFLNKCNLEVKICVTDNFLPKYTYHPGRQDAIEIWIINKLSQKSPDRFFFQIMNYLSRIEKTLIQNPKAIRTTICLQHYLTDIHDTIRFPCPLSLVSEGCSLLAIMHRSWGWAVVCTVVCRDRCSEQICFLLKTVALTNLQMIIKIVKEKK